MSNPAVATEMATEVVMKDADVRAGVRRLVRERGATKAARDLRMPRETTLAVGSDAEVLQGTLALAAERLAELKARAAT